MRPLDGPMTVSGDSEGPQGAGRPTLSPWGGSSERVSGGVEPPELFLGGTPVPAGDTAALIGHVAGDALALGQLLSLRSEAGDPHGGPVAALHAMLRSASRTSATAWARGERSRG